MTHQTVEGCQFAVYAYGSTPAGLRQGLSRWQAQQRIGGGTANGMPLLLTSSIRWRCAIHRARNILAKVPVIHQAEVKAAYWAIFDPTGEEPGERSIAVARSRADTFSATYGRQFPAAVSCLNGDLTSLFTYLRFPVEHHKRIRHSNFIERTFGETRRRVKVIGRLPGERSCSSLVWAVLDRASRGWRGVVMNPANVRQLQEIRRQLFATDVAHEEVVAEAVTAAA
jgi:putative transposase